MIERYEEIPEVLFAGSPGLGYASRPDFEEHARDYLPQFGYDEELRMQQFSSRAWNHLFRMTITREYPPTDDFTGLSDVKPIERSIGEVQIRSTIKGTNISFPHRAELFKPNHGFEKDLANLDALECILVAKHVESWPNIGPRILGFYETLINRRTSELHEQERIKYRALRSSIGFSEYINL